MSLNEIRPRRNIYRRKSRQVRVGDVLVGGDAPIAVQTMTNTDTADVTSVLPPEFSCTADLDNDPATGSDEKHAPNRFAAPRARNSCPGRIRYRCFAA